jgi:hypothetical protein
MWKRAWMLLALVAGCRGQGDVTFFVRAPSGTPDLSPLDDSRRDSIVITAIDQNGVAMPYGAPVSAQDTGQSMIGSVPIGTFDFRLTVLGGNEILGVAKARQVNIGSGANQLVTVDVRKPLAFFGSSKTFPRLGSLKFPTPTTLMGIDTTQLGDAAELAPSVSFSTAASATASTSDGRYLLVGAGGNLQVIDTLSDGATFATAQSMALPGSSSVSAIAVAPDDQNAAVVTDQGVILVGLARDGNGVPQPQVIGMLANPGNGAPPARAAVFAPDAQNVAAIASQPWSTVVDSCNAPPASSISTFTVGSVASAAWRPTAKGATGVAFDPAGTLIITMPCSSPSVVHESDGTPAVDGVTGVITVVSTGDLFAGVESPITSMPVSVDPNNPLATDPALSFGRFFVQTPAGIRHFQLEIPEEPLSFVFELDNGFQVQFYGSDTKLQPARLDAYSAALSPDGTHLVFASRVRYVANQVNFYLDPTDPRRHCDVDYTNEIYRITEVNLSSGERGYESLKGITDNNVACSYYCCNLNDPAQCDPENVRNPCLSFTNDAVPPPLPTITSGFVPAGVSILLGNQ